jgi:tetratricopeptide (TPR) repeat protein
MHRSRLALYESMTESPEFKNAIDVMTERRAQQLTDNLWNLSGVQRMQEQSFYLRREGSRYEAKRFLESAPIRENLPSAKSYFEFSRRASPLQPLVHLRIGVIKGVIASPRAGDDDIESALLLAPNNPTFRRVAGIYYLQSGNVEAAVPHLKRYLELLPRNFAQLMELVTGRTSRNLVPVDDSTIAEIIPDDPKMLYDYVVEFMEPDSPMKSEFLERAAQAVADLSYNDRQNHVISGDIRFEQGKLKKAVDAYQLALIRQPNDPETRHKRGLILVELGRLDEALEEAKYLKTHTEQTAIYNKFLSDVELAIEKRDQEKKK